MEKILNRQKGKPIVAIIIKKAGYNQKEIADLIGVRENYLNRSINKDPVPAKLLAKIADVIGVSVHALFDKTTLPPYRYTQIENRLNEPGEKYEVRESPEHVAAIENRMLKERVAQLERLLEEQTAIARDLLGMMKILTEKK